VLYIKHIRNKALKGCGGNDGNGGNDGDGGGGNDSGGGNNHNAMGYKLVIKKYIIIIERL
jgi:hypothetical protein